MSKKLSMFSREYIAVVLVFAVLCLSVGVVAYQPQSAYAQTCPPNLIERFGINVHRGDGNNLTSYDFEQLNLGWYLDYAYTKRAGSVNGVDYAHVIRTHFDTAELEQKVGRFVDANPGALWLAGNEPDRTGQDGITAEEYATFYHEVYTFLKDRDPSARVAIAGVVQPTALRLKYLDNVLAAYQSQYGTSLPVDVFNTHNFVMSERIISQGGDIIWGASIPPGFSVNDPLIRYLHPRDAWNLSIFKEQLRDLRQWMADNGYRNKPLVVSEYGVLLPEGWDFDGVGTANFMTQSFDFMLSETNSSTGYPGDGNRLVQSFSWFSLNYPDYDPNTGQGLPGAMFDFDDGAITDLGRTFRDYVENLIEVCDIAPTATAVPPTPTPVPSTATPEPLPTEDLPVETPVETPGSEPTEVPPDGPTVEPTAIPIEPTPDDEATPLPTEDPGNPVVTETPAPVATDGSTPTQMPTTEPGGATGTPVENPSDSNELGLLKGIVWYDFDRNGQFDLAYESTMSEMSVSLRWAGGDGLYNTGDDLVRNQQTTATGEYQFEDLESGLYRVTVEPAFSTVNGQAGLLTDASSQEFIVTINGETLAFKLAVHGNDLDQDGLGDTTEGAADYDGDGKPNYSDTDSDGDGLLDSAEGLTDANNNGQPDYLDTEEDGGDATPAPPGSTTLPQDPTATVTPSPTSTTIPTATPVAGPTPISGVLTGLAFVDINENGFYDANFDQPVEGAVVLLSEVGTDELTVPKSAITADNGYYRFTGVAPGSYQITIVSPDGYEPMGAGLSTITMTGENFAAPSIGLRKLPELPNQPEQPNLNNYFLPLVAK